MSMVVYLKSGTKKKERNMISSNSSRKMTTTKTISSLEVQLSNIVQKVRE